MNWDAIGAVGEILGALAVLVTLVYLALQVQHIKKHTESSALDHIINALNEFAGHIAQSESLADIIARGRESYDALNAEEKLRSDHIHMFLLNNLESWYLQHRQIYSITTEASLENIRGNIVHYFDYPGMRQFWAEVNNVFPHLAPLFDATLGDSDRNSGDSSLNSTGNLRNSWYKRIHSTVIRAQAHQVNCPPKWNSINLPAIRASCFILASDHNTRNL